MRLLLGLLAWLAGLAGCAVPGAVGPIEVVVPEPLAQLERAAEDVWVFCGPDMSDAVVAQRTLESYADNGVDVVFGQCNAPDWSSYSPAFPGQRYSTPEVYMDLVRMAAPLGLRVVVYDERVWSDDPAVRDAASAFWSPVARHIAAWDMGDEFDPAGPEWAILVQRWNVVVGSSLIPPFTNHLSWALDEALRDLPGSAELLSFDKYDGDLGVEIARGFDAATERLMCAVNGYDHGPFVPSIEEDKALLDEWCDAWLIFGGPPLSGVADFEEPSLVDELGHPTERLKGMST